ncbi:glucuronate isomerase [Parapedobacter indicus]|uniref:Uronate isomerase n=1 Tax=Parapedobacter indicus TaxID=1477437 RepID=A0A1I3CTV4_9SPHI|nr:glucuronate isomerase [Parapedobacter indicus]PPL04396.1 D-glucuronate isomerase [Parapedobacter indicus]SFH77930.1 D-glucuronate isomerase [Parapedobacter indicus]
MKKFLDEHFLLSTDTAQILYHEYAANMPIIDYHCHLPPQQIAENTHFDNITQVWLNGDHYKWRAMRTNGVDERYITGDASDREKFRKWAETVPYTMRNPLYHWTHLELQRYFGISELLNPGTADRIFDETEEKLQSPEYRVRGLLERMNVKIICTTDDPTDTLDFHQQLREEAYEIPVFPAFRPDAGMNLSDLGKFKAYVAALENVSGRSISGFDDYLYALKSRHDFFASMGCCVSDHGLEEIYAEDYTDEEVRRIFEKALTGQAVSDLEHRKFKSALLLVFAQWDAEKNWVQQYHLGALRNNNSRMMAKLGPDTGWDSIGDFRHGKALSKFLDRLDRDNQLAKTILYNLNPADNELMATMIGNFNDGSVAGKIQFGSAWWFLDQKDGMIKQINALANMGLLSRFLGMLTDSRSFLSFPRHEYFRRLLCDLFGTEIENGELPNDLPWIGRMIQDICYHNANRYFGWNELSR